MTRNEIIKLVSRAIAVIEFVSAVASITYLPERFAWLGHYQRVAASHPDSESFAIAAEKIEIAFFFGRTALYLVLAWVFWNCGPWISRLLLPETRNDATPSPTSEIQP